MAQKHLYTRYLALLDSVEHASTAISSKEEAHDSVLDLNNNVLLAPFNMEVPEKSHDITVNDSCQSHPLDLSLCKTDYGIGNSGTYSQGEELCASSFIVNGNEDLYHCIKTNASSEIELSYQGEEVCYSNSFVNDIEAFSNDNIPNVGCNHAILFQGERLLSSTMVVQESEQLSMCKNYRGSGNPATVYEGINLVPLLI